MKYLFLLLLVSCGEADFYNLFGVRKFKVGDCLIVSNKAPEKWEQKNPDYVVLELGKEHYRVQLYKAKTTNSISYGHLWEDFYQKVDCPKDSMTEGQDAK